MKLNLKVNPLVFFVSGIFAIVFVSAGAIFTQEFEATFNFLQDFIVSKFGWFYILSVAIFLIFVIYLLFSRYGDIKLGKNDDEPEFSLFTWFSMLFSAGMGIGLLFYSVAEPVKIFGNPPMGIDPQSVAAAKHAMNFTFFHWGLHAWGIYIVMGMSLAYFSYRHGLPLSVRSTLYPILGEKIYGAWGNIVEILAVLGTLFGVATSLGLGVMQVNAGLNHLGVITESTTNQVILISLITAAATISVVTGVGKGIRRLSEFNLCLGLILLLFVLIAGPTIFLFKSFVTNLGTYFQTILQTTFHTSAFQDKEWQKSWTLFYWGWWIAWSPFVGMFIARVSKGRTIREFIAGVLVVPTIITFIWLTVFGNTALYMEIFQGGQDVVNAVNNNMATALFVLLQDLPLQIITCSLAIVVVTLFFVTSSDSASLVIDILTSGGHAHPPIAQRVFWAVTEGIVAIILLVTGGLVGLQTAALTTALPFCVILFFICFSLLKGLKTEKAIDKTQEMTEDKGVFISESSVAVPNEKKVETPISEKVTPEENQTPLDETIAEKMKVKGKYSENWKKRLSAISKEQASSFDLKTDNISEIDKNIFEFMDNIVYPAFKELKEELEKYGKKPYIYRHAYQTSLTVYRGKIEEIFYAIRGKSYYKMSYAFPSFDTSESEKICVAQVILNSDPRHIHELDKFTKENIIHDFLNEYKKWALW